MNLKFCKYQGTGNDFVMIDNRSGLFNVSDLPIAKLCNRRFGIGADGLIVIENHSALDFNMIYFNSDGTQSFCGNGSRCAVLFAHNLGIIENKTTFLSTDGEHSAELLPNEEIKLLMRDVQKIEHHGSDFVLNTGSPHYVQYLDDFDKVDVCKAARKIRYSDEFKVEGININFVKNTDNHLIIRTYERGVEDETLSCGTGVTAVALAHHFNKQLGEGTFSQSVKAMGGLLKVHFTFRNGLYSDIYLQGPAMFVFEGNITV